MAAQEDLSTLIAAGDFDAVEEQWLSRLASDVEDLDFFVEVARGLAAAGGTERARLLLELLDEQIQDQRRWQLRLSLLRRAGDVLLDRDQVHPAITSSLRELYSDSPSFEGLAETVGLHRAVDDLPKTWQKVERLQGLLALDVGTLVWMDGKGVGRVTEVNLPLESFKVDFDRHPGLRVGFRAAGKLLQPLPQGHILRLKNEEPERLTKLGREDPAELLRLVLESHDRPLTGAEVRDILTTVVPDSRWASWWAAARKHPKVVAGSGSRQTYTWVRSNEAAMEAIWRSFEQQKVAGKLELLRRSADRDPSLRSKMLEALLDLGEQEVASRPALAFEIGAGLERAGVTVDTDWSPPELLRATENPDLLLEALESRQVRERAYLLLAEVRSDWKEILGRRFLRESDTKALDSLADLLRAQAPEILDQLEEQLVKRPQDAPAAFTWLAERAAEDDSLRERAPQRLLKQLLTVLSSKRFAGYHSRLLALCESGGTVPRLLPLLSSDEAQEARKSIERARALTEDQRQGLVNSLELKFPELRSETESVFYATQASIAAKRAEYENLLKVEIPANRRAIGEARALGDLSENFEYKSARQRHEYLSALAARLQTDLSRVRPIDLARVSCSEVRIGTEVRLTCGADPRSLTILGPWESQPENSIFSYESELAQSLLGKRAGDRVELDGKTCEILSIEPVKE